MIDTTNILKRPWPSQPWRDFLDIPKAPKRRPAREIPEDAYLSVRDAAAYVRISQARVLRMIHSGQLPAIDVGERGRKKYRIARGAIDAALAVPVIAPKKSKRRPRRPAGYVERY